MKEAEDEGIFVPEKNWKAIKPGQAIPRGIHVRIDMTTGERQGKLIDKEDEANGGDPRENTRVQHVPTEAEAEEEEDSQANDGQLEDSRQRLQAAFHKFLGDDPPPVTQVTIPNSYYLLLSELLH